MAIVLRADTGSALSHNQVDTNFTSFFFSSSISGNTITLFKTGSGALSIAVASSSISLPGGTLWTASAVDISRYSDVTVTGSFKQGSAGLTATGLNSHAEGFQAQAIGWHSHAEGRQTQARGSGSHAEGYVTIATGSYSHAEGQSSIALGIASHAEGLSNVALGDYSHAEGYTTTATGSSSHTEGIGTIASGSYSHAEGQSTIAVGESSHAEGYFTVAGGQFSHAEGRETLASGEASHAEGYFTTASGNYSHAEGWLTIASGAYSHAEGRSTLASGSYSHAEGQNTQASGQASHAEGSYTVAVSPWSHAEGSETSASGHSSHAEGRGTEALGYYSHAEGRSTLASAFYAHTEGYLTTGSGQYSHAEGLGTVAAGLYQHTQGQYNISSSAQSAFIIGNGTSNANRSNLVFASGSQFQVTGSLLVSGGNLTVQGNITAEQYIVSTSVYYVTESYSSGSHIFGNSLDDTHQFTGSVIVEPDITLPGSSSIYFGTKALASTSSFGVFRDSAGRLAIGNNITGTGYGADGIKIDSAGKVQLNHINQNYNLYDTTLNIIGSGSNDGITMTQWPDTSNKYRITIESSSRPAMNFSNAIHPNSGSFDFSGSVAVTRNITAGVNVIAGSTVQGLTVHPTSALILDGAGNNGMKLSGSTANIFFSSSLTVGSGSYASPNVAEYVRINSGGLTITSGSGFFINGTKQFNHAMFSHTASVPIANGTSGSVPLSVTTIAEGISIVSGSRITVANPGDYKIQFGAQLAQGAGTANFYLWLKKNGANIANTTSVNTLPGNTNELMTVSILDYASNAGDYYEIAHQSNAANSTLEYIAASGNIPAAPSIIVVVTQGG